MTRDDIFHAAFRNDVYYKPTEPPVYCKKCDTRIKVYYAEERLYAVRCCYCESITLVKAANPVAAASYVGYRRLGDELLKRYAETKTPTDDYIRHLCKESVAPEEELNDANPV